MCVYRRSGRLHWLEASVNGFESVIRELELNQQQQHWHNDRQIGSLFRISKNRLFRTVQLGPKKQHSLSPLLLAQLLSNRVTNLTNPQYVQEQFIIIIFLIETTFQNYQVSSRYKNSEIKLKI